MRIHTKVGVRALVGAGVRAEVGVGAGAEGAERGVYVNKLKANWSPLCLLLLSYCHLVYTQVYRAVRRI